jgi:hypothetical protein
MRRIVLFGIFLLIIGGTVEISGTTPGVYTAWVTDSAGVQVSESWRFSIEGEIRTFFPRWVTTTIR